MGLLAFAHPFETINNVFATAELLQRIHEAVASSDSAAGGPQPDVHSKYLYFSLAELILVSGVASWSAGDLYDGIHNTHFGAVAAVLR